MVYNEDGRRKKAAVYSPSVCFLSEKQKRPYGLSPIIAVRVLFCAKNLLFIGLFV